MSFYIVRIEPDPGPDGLPVETPLENYGPYKTGALAASFAKKVSRDTGQKIVPRRIRQAPEWRGRALERVGRAQPMPEGWDLPPIEDHFAHPDLSKPWLIAYTPNADHGVIGKVRETKPGAYIAKFYPHVPDEALRKYAAMFDDMSDVRLAQTPEEIEWVYENGPGSCMTLNYQKNQYGSTFLSPVHPTRVYAAGDLAVAWVADENGKVAQRALCWPSKKRYGRVYGNGTGKLEASLEALGYTQPGRRAFDGARLLRILHHYMGSEYFVVPYLDHGINSGGGGMSFRDDGTNLIIGNENGTMDANQTRGIVQAVKFDPENVVQRDDHQDAAESDNGDEDDDDGDWIVMDDDDDLDIAA